MIFPDEPYSSAERLVISQVRLDVAALDKHGEGAKSSRAIVYREKGHCHVELSKSGLTRLPLAILDQIERHVQRLNLSENRLTGDGVPYRLSRCEKLYYVKLAACRAPVVPHGIFSVLNLAVLDISQNELVELDRRLVELKTLRAISASHNKITSLPGWLLRMNLIHLQLTANPIQDAPPEIWDTAHPRNAGKKTEKVTEELLSWLARHKAHEADDASLTLRLPDPPANTTLHVSERDGSLSRLQMAPPPLSINKSLSPPDSSFSATGSSKTNIQPSASLSDLSIASANAATSRRPSTSRSERTLVSNNSSAALSTLSTQANLKNTTRSAQTSQVEAPLRPSITRTATSFKTPTSSAQIMIPATHILQHVTSIAAATLRFAAHLTLELSLCLQLGDMSQPGVTIELLDNLHTLHLCSEELIRSIQNIDGHNTDRQDFLNAVIGNYVYPMEMLKGEALNDLQALITTTQTFSIRAIAAIINIMATYNNDIRKAHGRSGMELADRNGVLSIVVQDAQGRPWNLTLPDDDGDFNIYTDMSHRDTSEERQTGGIASPLVVAMRKLLDAVIESTEVIRSSLADYAHSGTLQHGKPDLMAVLNGAGNRITEIEESSATLASCLRFELPDHNTLLASGEELCFSLTELITNLVSLMHSNEAINQRIKPIASALRLYTREAFTQISNYRTTSISSGGSSASLASTASSHTVPPTPLRAALGAPAARLVAKDTSGVFKRIDELQNRTKKKY